MPDPITEMLDKMTKSMQELEAYDKLPTDPEGRNKVYNLVRTRE